MGSPLNLKENGEWTQAEKNLVRIHDILIFIEENYGIKYAENTRETIRRQTIHQFEQAGIVVKNSDDSLRPTNSPKTNYIISDDSLSTIKKYKTDDWETALDEFISKKGKLIDRYNKTKERNQIYVQVDGTEILFSPGKHNELQVKIMAEFREIFCPNTKVVYVGDASMKLLHFDEDLLKELGIPITKHDKLPDVVLYDEEKDYLFLIEAVTSHGPLSPKRQIELEKTLRNSAAKRIYISAFPDFTEFKRHANDIAWDTEVWIEDNPHHMIHFNGPQFFTVYK